MIRASYSNPPSDPAETGLEQAGDGKMWLDARFRPELDAAGLTGFEAVMATSQGCCLRVLADRENWRLELPGSQAAGRRFYLKRHHVRTWGSRLRAKLGSGPGHSAGRAEARNIRRLAAEGIASMELVAYGEALRPDGRIESFVLTEELAGYEPLDDFLRRRFAAIGSHSVAQASSLPKEGTGRMPVLLGHTGKMPGLRGRARDRHLDRLVREVAAVARRLHAAGYNHRDLYCCHFFVREPSRGQFEVRLIDLQRVERRRRFRWRWLVKDLGQLAYSAPRGLIQARHRLAFVRHYLGVEKLRPGDKRLIRAVLAKQRRMERREGLAG